MPSRAVLRAALLAATFWTVLAGASAAEGQTITYLPTAENSPVSVGVSLPQAPWDLPPISSYVQTFGVAPRFLMWYVNFGTDILLSYQEQNLETYGTTPMVTWNPTNPSHDPSVTLESIASGADDSYLESQAVIAKDWGQPLYIRFGPEMNISEYPWGDGENTSAQYVAAWQHVVNVFRAAGATNVRWVWCPNVNANKAFPFTAYYPGDGYVDWVALDGYNWAGFDNRGPWLNMYQVFDASYQEMEALTSKPMMIAETASNPSGGNQAEWITNGFLFDLRYLMPKIRAVEWWDYEYGGVDWQLTSSAATEAAWKQVVHSPHYGG